MSWQAGYFVGYGGKRCRPEIQAAFRRRLYGGDMNLTRPGPARLAALLVAVGVVAGGALQRMAVSAPAPTPLDARATLLSADELAALKAAAVAAQQRKDPEAAIAA